MARCRQTETVPGPRIDLLPRLALFGFVLGLFLNASVVDKRLIGFVSSLCLGMSGFFFREQIAGLRTAARASIDLLSGSIVRAVSRGKRTVVLLVLRPTLAWRLGLCQWGELFCISKGLKQTIDFFL